MPATRIPEAGGEGASVKAKGQVRPGSGAFGELPITWAARAEHQHGKTSPEELIAAAHASCYCMAFSNGLSKAGHQVERLDTTAEVDFVPGTGITQIRLSVRGRVKGIDAAGFHKLAEEAKTGCPVSQALKAVPISLEARLV